MKKIVLALPVVFLLLAAKQSEKDAKKELKKFAGTWEAVSLEVNGTKAGANEGKGLKAIVEGNTLTIKHGEKTVKATFTIDPSKDPKWLDSITKAGGKELKSLGIYKFEDDKLSICYTLGSGKRPKKFSTKGGTKEAPIFLTVYEKAKEE